MCPARLILLPPGSRERLTGERIAAVYTTPAAEAPATQLAEELGAPLTLLPALTDPTQAEPRPVEAIVRGIADQHRGETVVVIAPDLDLGLELPAVIEHEGDGWTVQPSPNEITLATYEQAADQFRASIPTTPNAFLIELFDLIDAHLPAGGHVLELGSGTGRDAVDLEQRGHRVRRTDAATSFVDMIRADGYEADQLNALTDDFGGPYDLVFADAVFLHFTPTQLATVLRKAHAAAGLLAFTTSEGDGDEWSNRYLDLPRHFTSWQEQPLRTLLATTGWTVLAWQRGQATRSGWYYVLARRT
jgi:SAM-dependent methyltransferase